ncbi:MAG: hypothetical protein ABWX57_10270 [Aeromicrobium sp.]
MLQAHGLGGGSDLPIPAQFAIVGGGAALTVSFLVLLFAWRRPRFALPAPAGTTPETSDLGGTPTGSGRFPASAASRVRLSQSALAVGAGGRPVPAGLAAVVDSRWFAALLRALGLAFAAFIAAAAVAGQDVLTNPTFGVAYAWLWVGIVPLSLLFGPFFKALSPARTMQLALTKVAGGGSQGGPSDGSGDGVMAYPTRWGYWPAAVGLFAFVWLELVYPDATYLGPVRLWFGVYFAVMLVGSAVFGSTWLARADPFEVYSTLVAHLSVWGRDETGRLVVRNPLRNLSMVPAAPGLVAVVAVLLGSTAFDSFRSSNYWLRTTQDMALPVTPIDTLLLLVACALVGVTFSAATAFSGADPTRLSGSRSRWQLPAVFAHSVVPIIVGYMVAHYLTFFVETGQLTLVQLSDPLSTGADVFGTGDRAVNYWLSYHPTFLASVKVLAIVAGHVLGAIAAHDRALQVLPRRNHLTGQLPLLCAMVAYTFAGLYLLFGA